MEMDADCSCDKTDEGVSACPGQRYHLAYTGSLELMTCPDHLLDTMLTCRVDTLGCGEFLESYVEPENEAIAQTWLKNKCCACVGISPDVDTEEAGVTLLHVAASQGHTALVRSLLQRVPGLVNIKTLYTQQTALHMAITSEHPPPIELIETLINEGVDVKEQDLNFGNTALFRAVELNHAFLIPVLASAGSPVDGENAHGSTPLLAAAHAEKMDCVYELVKAGACASQCSPNTWSPVSIAIRNNNLDMAKVLLSGKCDMDCQGYGGTALHHAVHGGSEPFVRLLLEAGANPNTQNMDGHTPLMVASYNNNPDVARILLTRGASVNVATDHGYTALHLAAWDGHLVVVHMLLSAGALHDQPTDDRNTPLALACHGHQLSIIRCLLPVGCNVDNADKDADTPMHYVAYNGCLESMKLLLSYGANPDVENHYCTTPLWNAVRMKHTAIVHELLLSNVRLNVVSRGINQRARTDSVVLIYTRPRSPLFVACDRGCFDIAKVLILAGTPMVCEQWFWRREYPAALEMARDMQRWLATHALNPLSLKRISRAYLRAYFGGKLKERVQHLEVPNTLKDFLQLKYL